jgi:curved DNA-binding protein
MNPYKVLNVPYSASISDIKKSYRKLVIKYHPDKCQDKDAIDKFRDIQTAYELLSKPEYKNNYDNLDDNSKLELYNSFKSYFSTKYPSYYTVFENIYSDEEDLKTDVNSFNLFNIYQKVMNKITNYNIFDLININDIDNNGDINGTINVSLLDVYLNKSSKIKVLRKSRNSDSFIVPLNNNTYIIKGEGELKKDGSYGDIIINVNIDYQNYIVIDKKIYLNVEIPLYNYLYGGEIDINFINNEIINIKYDNFIDNAPLKVLNNMGLIKNDSKERDDFIIIFKIKDFQNPIFQDRVKIIYENIV